MSPDDIVFTFPLTDEIKTRFNNALSEYEKLHKSMKEKLIQFNKNFVESYFLINKYERLSIVSDIKMTMLYVRRCDDAIVRIKYLSKNTTVTDNDLCFLDTDLEWEYTNFHSRIEKITKQKNDSTKR